MLSERWSTAVLLVILLDLIGTAEAGACTNPSDCNSHASSVSGSTPNCNCVCSSKYTGTACDQCNTGYENYDTCSMVACTSSADCNNHASSVSGNVPTGCTCTCQSKYKGATCNQCNTGYQSYPTCSATPCTSSADCNNHASSVSGTIPSGCTCTCSSNYKGATCNSCATNYQSYPTCSAIPCTKAANCNSHASSVSGTLVSGCTCTCYSKYKGATCNQCNTGYQNYATCSGIPCTSSANCNNHASSVSGTIPTGCTCTCSSNYKGTTCNQCNTGYQSYPTCSAIPCTKAANCNSHASSVSGTVPTGCTCTCYSKYKGATCNQCDTGYENYATCSMVACTNSADCNSHASSVSGNVPTGCTCTCQVNYRRATCDRCATNYESYPTCSAIACTKAANCNSHASAVSGTLVSGCTCTCSAKYAGATCDQCNTNYEAYPICSKVDCTVADNCNSHATTVTGNKVDGCTCTCSTGFKGATCNGCATNYQNYPTCSVIPCTKAANCNSHASSVSGTLVSGCTCTCSSNYKGTTCNQCNTGYQSYPTCSAIPCTIAANCNNHASAVSGTIPLSGTCSCTCETGFGGSDCGQCGKYYVRYPNCVTMTTTHSPSVSVAGTASPTPTMSLSMSVSTTSTETPPATPTKSHSVSVSVTQTISLSPTFSQSISKSELTLTMSDTQPIPPSMTAPETPSDSLSSSVSTTHTLSLSISRTQFSPSFTTTITHPLTQSDPGTISDPVTQSGTGVTFSGTKTATASPSVSYTVSTSVSSSVSPTASLTQTETVSPSQTLSHSITSTQTITQTATEGTQTKTPSFTVTQTISSSASSTYTGTMSAALTTSAIPPTTTPVPTPTLSFFTKCPPSCGNGRCSSGYPYQCECHSDQLRGFWEGGNLHGGICNECQPGVFGPTCKQPCPGGLCAPCSNHGKCFDGVKGNGTCGCFGDPINGYWKGGACETCQPLYYGSHCQIRCNCSTHGRCVEKGLTVTCNCSAGWSGEECNVCAKGHYGGNCTECPGGHESPCNGRGLCYEGNKGNGTCQCFYPYNGTACTVECPECPCEGSGCIKCPGPTGLACYKQGNCTLEGTCKCNEGFAGVDCNTTCLRGGPSNEVCSGHGSCNFDGGCTCDYNVTGYWNGTASCSACSPTHSGENCTLLCPLNSNGVVCSGNGDCVDGVCQCQRLYCGEKCSLTESDCAPCPQTNGVDRWGSACENLCQCYNGTCDHGKRGSGACSCASGWRGTKCEVECLGGMASPCNHHGTCLADANCTCEGNYAGITCNITCPKDNSGAVCSGHGACFSGTSGNGTCNCWNDPEGAGAWSGENCDICALGWSGETCTTKCILGATMKKICQCNTGVGGEQCDQICPIGENNLRCSGNGLCGEGWNATGGCTCNPPYQGPSCNCSVSVCLAVLPNSACNTNTGECQCDRWHQGELCQNCAIDFWGFTCREPCACRKITNGTQEPLRGTCDRSSGFCSCYRDSIHGYWSGSRCEGCLDGYFGDECLQKSVISSQVASLSLTFPSKLYRYRSLKLIIDDDYRFVYTVGGIITIFNTSSIMQTSIVFWQLASNMFSCGEVAFSWLLGYRIYFVLPAGECREHIEIRSMNRLKPDSSPSSLPKANLTLDTVVKPLGSIYITSIYVYSWGAACFVSNDFLSGAFYLDCVRLKGDGSFVEAAPSLILTSFFEVSGIEYLPDELSLVIYGSQLVASGATACQAVMVPYTLDRRIPVFGNSPTNLVQSFSTEVCSKVDIVRFIGSGSIYAVVNGFGPQLMVVKNSSFLMQKPPFVPTTLSGLFSTTSATVDLHSQLVLLTQCKAQTDIEDAQCHIVKVSAAKGAVELYGLQQINRKESISDMRVSRVFITYMLIGRYNGVYVRRILMWDVVSVYPPIADRSGQTMLTVTGSNFRNTNDLQCFVAPSGSLGGGDGFAKKFITKATFINETAVKCLAPPTDLLSTCDIVDYVEVSLGGDAFTVNRVSLRRADPPVISHIQPNKQSLYAPAFDPVTVTGAGYASASSVTCRFGIAGNYTFTKGTVPAISVMICEPPVKRQLLPKGSSLDVSLDGTVYTGYPLPYTIIGYATSIRFESTSSQVASFETSWLYFVVDLIDEKGNTVLEFDDTPYPVVLDGPYIWTNATAEESTGSQQQVVRKRQQEEGNNGSSAGTVASLILAPKTEEYQSWELRGTTGEKCINGVCQFKNVFLHRPRVAVSEYARPHYRATILISEGVTWHAFTEVEITVGAGTQLQILFPISRNVSETGELSETPVIVVVDSGGNQLPRNDPFLLHLEVTAEVLETIPPGTVLVSPPANHDKQNKNKTVGFSNGLAEFRPMTIYARHGIIYNLRFVTRKRKEIKSVMSETINSQCPPATFMINGLYECTQCVEHGTCDGKKLKVEQGWWRGSAISMELYRCQSDEVCPGGAPASCAETYRGPICLQCDTGNAKGLDYKCGKCPTDWVNIFFIVAVLLGITMILSLFIVYTVQNADRINNFAIVLQMFVSHWQTLAIFAYLDNPWPGYFSTMTNTIDAFADFRIMDSSFGACLLSMAGLTFTEKYIFQMLLSSEVFICMGVCRGLIFLFPNILKRRGDHGIVRPTLPITNWRLFANSFLIVIFFLFQGLLFYSLGMLNCKEVQYSPDDRRSILTADVSVDCNSSTYQAIRLFAVPIAVLLLFGVPIMLTAGYWLHANVRPADRNYRYQLGAFLLGGLSRSAWYWPAVVFFRKGLLVGVVVLTRFPLDSLLAMWIVIGYFSLQLYVRPYHHQSHHQIDAVGNAAALICINLATLYHTAGNEDWLRDAVAPLVIVFETISTVLYIFYMSGKLQHHVLQFVGLRPPDAELEEDPVEVPSEGVIGAIFTNKEMARAFRGLDDGRSDDEGEINSDNDDVDDGNFRSGSGLRDHNDNRAETTYDPSQFHRLEEELLMQATTAEKEVVSLALKGGEGISENVNTTATSHSKIGGDGISFSRSAALKSDQLGHDSSSCFSIPSLRNPKDGKVPPPTNRPAAKEAKPVYFYIPTPKQAIDAQFHAKTSAGGGSNNNLYTRGVQPDPAPSFVDIEIGDMPSRKELQQEKRELEQHRRQEIKASQQRIGFKISANNTAISPSMRYNYHQPQEDESKLSPKQF